MNRILLSFVAISSLFLIGCNKGQLENTESLSTETVNEEQLNEIAKIFASIQVGAEDLSTVFSSVQAASKYGLDEEMYLSELWIQPNQTKVSVDISNGIALRNKLEQYISSTTKSPNDAFKNPESLLQLLQSGNVEIYWPYSDYWDGYSLPVITYLQELDDNNCAIAYNGIDTDQMKQILVSEEYAKEHPVWVITEPEIRYEDLPNFNNGETKAGDVTYLSVTPATKADSNDGNAEHLYWGLSGIICRKQYDSWLRGASDFKFVVAYPQGSTANYVTGATTEFSVKVKRSYIDEKNPTEYTLTNRALNQDWTETQITNYLCIYEVDTNSSKNSVEVSVTVKAAIPDSLKQYLQEVSAVAKFTIGKKDEEIGKEVMARSYILSNTWNNRLYPLDYGKNGKPNMELRFNTTKYN